MAKKKSISKEEIATISHERLVALVASLVEDNKEVLKMVEKLLLANDPSALVKSIKKDIASINRGRKFISYYESFDFSKKIALIVADISTLIEDKKSASSLYKALILTDSKVYLRSDDSAGAIQSAYALAEDGWSECLEALGEDEIYHDMVEMRICEGFGVRYIFSEKVPRGVLERLYDAFYPQAKESGDFSDIYTLQEAAHYLKNPKLYIEARALGEREFSHRDFIDIAKEFQHADDAQGVLAYLAKIHSVDRYFGDDFYGLKIWAYERQDERAKVTEAYKEWYAMSQSVSVLKKYLARLAEKEKNVVLQKALEEADKRPFGDALNFYYALDEVALAAKYIETNPERIDTNYLYEKDLKKYEEWLKKVYPQAAILLYRNSCEKALETSQSKHYPWAIKALKRAIMIEQESDIKSGKIDDSATYMQALFEEHKRKPKFVQLFLDAFGG